MFRRALLLGSIFALVLASASARAANYEVRITNLTLGQTFTPILVVSHRGGVQLFDLGVPASAELEILAEAGSIGPLESFVRTLPQVRDTATNGALLGPGETTTIRVRAGGAVDRISVAGMLIPTNDTFVGLRSLMLPRGAETQTAFALAYDSGTEPNDQNCAHIPGPRCGGEGSSARSPQDEGFVHVSNGFHELGRGSKGGGEILGPKTYDWRNPVARITVRLATSASSDDDEDGD